MKKNISILLTSAVFLTGILAGCSDSENEDTKENAEKTEVNATTTEEDNSESNEDIVAHDMGKVVNVSNESGDSVDFKVLSAKVDENEKGEEDHKDDYYPGGHFIKVTLNAKNMGKQSTDPMSLGDVVLLDKDDVEYTSTYTGFTAIHENEDGLDEIKPNLSKDVYATFNVPKDFDLQKARMIISSGSITENNETYFNLKDAETEVKNTEENAVAEVLSKEDLIEYINKNPDNEGPDYNKDIQKIIDDNENERASIKYQLVQEYAYKYKPSKKQLNTFTQYIVDDYKQGTYLDRADEDKYMLTNIFKAILVERYYGDNADTNPYGAFAFDFMQNTRDVYRGNQTIGDIVTEANESQMNKSLAEM